MSEIAVIVGHEKASIDSRYKRARQDIYQRHYSAKNAKIHYLKCSVHTFIECYMMPLYVFKAPDAPIRVLSAVSLENRNVIGATTLDGTKVSTALTLVTGALMFLTSPTAPIPTQFLLSAAIGVVSYVMNRHRLFILYEYQEYQNKLRFEANESFQTTCEDKSRQEETSRDANSSIGAAADGHLIKINSEYFKILGLNPSEPLTQEKLQTAFVDTLKKTHPDHGGNNEATRGILEARTALLKALKAKSKRTSSRSYSTMTSDTRVHRFGSFVTLKSAAITTYEKEFVPLRKFRI